MTNPPSIGSRDTTSQLVTASPVRARTRRGRTGTATEWAIVILFVAGAILSATAFWQATVLGEASSQLTNRARFNEAQSAQERSSLVAQLAHDRRVLLGCRNAETRRDAAITTYSRSFDAQSLRTLVEGEHVRVALEGLLANQRECANYSVGSLLDRTAFERLGNKGTGDPVGLRSDAADLAKAEQSEVLAAVLFAVVLLAVTLADATNGPWVVRWLRVAAAFLVTGLVVAIAAFIQVRIVAWQPVVLLAVVFIALGGIGLRFRTLDRGGRPSRMGIAARRRARRLAKRAGFRLGHPLRWWAELLGAATLVVFAVAVLGFTVASINERVTLGRADERTAQARQALELGQQSALAVLAFSADLSELDARLAASGSNDELSEHPSLPDWRTREIMLGPRWRQEEKTWESLLTMQADPGQPGCLRPELILPWHDPTPIVADDANGSPLPERLITAHEDPGAVVALIGRSSIGSEFCATQAAVLQDEAEGWSASGSIFTVALVVLGLAGFLFASAADADRSRAPRRWLFASGTMGLAAGIAVAAAAFITIPRPLTEEGLETGTMAYVEASNARNCATMRGRAAEAARKLRAFTPARVLAANARLCTDDRAWLIGGAVSKADRDAFVGGLRAALGSADVASVEGNLGWGYALQAMAADADSNGRADALGLAQRHTNLALQADPADPYWCFNRALLTYLSEGAAAAEDDYREALNALDHTDASSGPCQPAPFTDVDLRDWMRLQALTDLELTGTEGEADGIRELIVGSAGEGREGSCDSLDAEGLTLRFYPQEIGLDGIDDSTAGDPFSAIWYYHETDGEPWSILINPSWSTITPGCYTDLLEVPWVLPSGEYRVDLYVDGHLRHQVTEENTWWSDGLDAAASKRIVVAGLGLSAVIPAQWELLADTPGVEVVYGGSDGHVAFGRLEGMASESMQPALVEWAGRWLESWDTPDLEAHAVPVDEGDAWYLDMEHTIVATPRDELQLGVGQDQYLESEAGRLLDDVDDVSCPGAVRMTLIEADDAELVNSIWLSQRRIGAQYTVPASDIAVDDVFIGPEFSQAVPEGWTGAGCPGHFVATAPERAANFLISRVKTSESLPDYVQTQIDAYSDPEGTFTDWALESREQVTLLGGVLGEKIVYTWTSDGTPVRQTQVYALVEGEVFYLTFTTPPEDSETFAPELSYVLSHYRIGPTEGILPAACDNCDAAATLIRQGKLDELASTLNIIDRAYCSDTTDDAEPGTFARIGCTLPGGFRVDAHLWAEPADLRAFAAPFRALPDAVVQDWYLYGTEYPRTGTTVEWVADGEARFFWTYDDLLISVNAALAGGDATRLNNWWSTSGALVRE